MKQTVHSFDTIKFIAAKKVVSYKKLVYKKANTPTLSDINISLLSSSRNSKLSASS